MGKEHRLPERRQAIASALQEAGQLSVSELSARFGVSEVTIRADLQALHQQGLILRTRGGGLALNVMPELSYEVRKQQFADKKARIGEAAARLIRSGSTIAIDASTTAQTLIPYVKDLPELTVITNSLKVATSLLGAHNVHVIMPGGSLRRESISLVGQDGYESFGGNEIDLGFFGARGITIEQGLTDVNPEEVRTKQALVNLCQRVVIMIDARKWGQVAATTFASMEKIDIIITDTSAPLDLVEGVRKQGVEVQLV